MSDPLKVLNAIGTPQPKQAGLIRELVDWTVLIAVAIVFLAVAIWKTWGLLP